mgnify:CR=1 FL=1
MKVMFLQNSKKIEIKQLVLIIFLITIINVSPSFADQLKIFSDKLEINRENKMSIFTGNVYAHETEFEIWKYGQTPPTGATGLKFVTTLKPYYIRGLGIHHLRGIGR